jgi:hypothetical protein
MPQTPLNSFDQLWCDCRRAGMRVLLELSTTQLPRVGEPRLRIIVLRGKDEMEMSAWAEAGAQLNHAANGALTRLTARGLLP